jgi:hypothetical protein
MKDLLEQVLGSPSTPAFHQEQTLRHFVPLGIGDLGLPCLQG